MAKIRPIGGKYLVNGIIAGRRHRLAVHSKAEAVRLRDEMEANRTRERLGLPAPPPSFDSALKAFLRSKERIMRPRAWERYRGIMRGFSAWLSRSGHYSELLDVGPRIIERYRDWRLGEGRSDGTVAHELTVIGIFFRWCIKMQFCVTNPARHVDRPRPHRRLPRTFEPQELDLIFREAEERGLFYEFLYRSGFRLAEALEVKVGDIALDRHLIRYINLKERRDEWCEIGEKLAVILVKLIDGKKHDDFIFPEERRAYDRSRGRLLVQFKSLIRQLGLPGGRCLHSLKASYVTHLLDAGVNPRIVQRLAHHKDLKTTLLYDRGPSAQVMKGAVDRLPI